MIEEIYFKFGVLFFLIVFFVVRSRFVSHYKGSFFRRSIKYLILALLMILYFLGYFDFANFNLNIYVRILLGLGLVGFGMFLFFWAHMFLGKNWTPVIEKKFSKSRKLVRAGPYKYVRHPIYSASFISVFGLGVFMSNWFFTGIVFLMLVSFYFYKIPAEEDELIRNFGKDYKKYMKEVGGIFPKLI